MDGLMPSSLVETLDTLEDPWGDRTQRHKLTDILVQSVLVVILLRRCVRRIRQSLTSVSNRRSTEHLQNCPLGFSGFSVRAPIVAGATLHRRQCHRLCTLHSVKPSLMLVVIRCLVWKKKS